MRLKRRDLHAVLATALLAAPAVSRLSLAATEAPVLRLSRLEGFGFLATHVAEDQKLLEKHAALLGIADLRVEWTNLHSGIAGTDGLLAGYLDINCGTTPSLLLIWDKTKGEVRSLAALSGLVSPLVTRNPDIYSIKDFGPNDRIAVPSLRVAPGAVVIGMALDQAFGPGSHGRLDSIQVQLGHSDAVIAMLNPKHEINSHFSTLPFSDVELRSTAPKIRQLLTYPEVMGGNSTTNCVYATRAFVAANPLKAKAVLAALDEANMIIRQNPVIAARSYIRVTGEKWVPENLADLLMRDDNVFTTIPLRSMAWATQMARTGLIKQSPLDWKDYHHAEIIDRDGGT
jgi:NitT/TauT family transport system substrate-binding protein